MRLSSPCKIPEVCAKAGKAARAAPIARRVRCIAMAIVAMAVSASLITAASLAERFDPGPVDVEMTGAFQGPLRHFPVLDGSVSTLERMAVAGVIEGTFATDGGRRGVVVGLDTGGTYTDGAAAGGRRVIASAKSLHHPLGSGRWRPRGDPRRPKKSARHGHPRTRAAGGPCRRHSPPMPWSKSVQSGGHDIDCL